LTVWDMNCQECGENILQVDTMDEKQILRLECVCDNCMTRNSYTHGARKIDELVKYDPAQKRIYIPPTKAAKKKGKADAQSDEERESSSS